MFFFLAFPVAHASHGYIGSLMMPYPRYVTAFLIWYPPIWPNILCASATDVFLAFGGSSSFYSHPRSLRSSLCVFMYSSWSKCILMTLLVCLSLYQNPLSSFFSWYQPLWCPHTVPICISSSLSHWNVCMTHGGCQSKFAVPAFAILDHFCHYGSQSSHYFLLDTFLLHWLLWLYIHRQNL